MPQDAQDLTVWQRAIDLTVCIYRLTQSFPKQENTELEVESFELKADG